MTDEVAIDLIKRFEGLPDGDPSTVNLDPYMDPIGIWTIGWGHAIRVGNRFLRGAIDKAHAKKLYPNGITRDQAETLLRADVLDVQRDVEVLLKRTPTDGQLAALVSFTFNLGAGALRRSTLLRHFNAGRIGDAAGEFGKWVRAEGRVLRGLVRRREAEKAAFLS